MSIVTKTGDKGKTSTYCGNRVSKAHPIMDIIGDLDELNCWLGQAKQKINTSSLADHRLIYRITEQIQRNLYEISAYIATQNSPKEPELDLNLIEEYCKYFEDNNPKLTGFVFPDNFYDIPRVICRRVERKIVAYFQGVPCPVIFKYINRISDLLFLIARSQSCDTKYFKKFV